MPDPRKNISWEPVQTSLTEPKLSDVIWDPIQQENPNNLKEKLLSVLRNLPVNTPDSFRKGAERAASFLSDLEEGKQIIDREFIEGIQRSFILPATVLSRVLSKPIAMPPWIGRLPQGIPPLNNEQQEQANAILEKVGEMLIQKTNGYSYSPQSGAGIGQTYFVLRESKTVPGNSFKVYIEGISQLDEEKILRLFNEVIALGVSPDEFKHHEGNTVLYWKNEKKETADQFNALCRERRIEARGPASDVFVVQGFRENTLKYKVISNDQVGTSVTSGFEWKEGHYSPEQFFKQWIQLCFAIGRRPDAAGFSAFLIAETPEDADFNYNARVQSAYEGSLPIMFLARGNRASTKTDCFIGN